MTVFGSRSDVLAPIEGLQAGDHPGTPVARDRHSLRRLEVTVGAHLPPRNEKMPTFLERFSAAYAQKRSDPIVTVSSNLNGSRRFGARRELDCLSTLPMPTASARLFPRRLPMAVRASREARIFAALEVEENCLPRDANVTGDIRRVATVQQPAHDDFVEGRRPGANRWLAWRSEELLSYPANGFTADARRFFNLT
jgi:hypothetical protein